MAILAGLVKRQSDNLPKLDAISMFSFLGRNPDFFGAEIRGTKAESYKMEGNLEVSCRIKDLGAFHIDSFNYVINNVNKIISEIDPVYVSNGKISVSKIVMEKIQYPMDLRHRKHTVYPSEARLRAATYYAELHVELCLHYDQDLEYFTRIFYVPVMLKSNLCVLKGLNKKELIKVKEDNNDPGGYFIVKGKERLFRHFVVMRRNFPLAVIQTKWHTYRKGYSDYGIIIRSVKDEFIFSTIFLHYLNDGSYEVRLYCNLAPFFIQVCLILKALVNKSDREIFESILKYNKEFNVFKLKGMLRALHDKEIFTQHDAKIFLGKEFSRVLRLSSRMSYLEATDYVLKKSLLVHLDANEEKFEFLCFSLCKLHSVVTDESRVDDLDNPVYQEILSTGQIYLLILKDRIKKYLESVHNLLKKAFKTRTTVPGNFKKYCNKATSFSPEVVSIIATGNFTGQDYGLASNTGYTIALKRTNMFQIAAQFSAIHKFSLLHYSKNMRKYYPESWGFICPTQTPEGENIGLCNHLASQCKVVTLNSNRIDEAILFKIGVLPLDHRIIHSDPIVYPVIVDGKITGWIEERSIEQLLMFFRVKKRNDSNEIPYHSEIVFLTKDQKMFPAFYLFSSPCRLIRKIVNQKTQKEEFIGMLEQVFFDDSSISEEHRYSEIHHGNILSLSSRMIPFCDNNSTVRNIYSSEKMKQALGLPFHNFNGRSDTKHFQLLSAQHPILSSKLYSESDFSFYPCGTNVTVAVIAYSSYDMEDAVVLNRASVERGLMQNVIYKTFYYDLKELAEQNECNPSDLELKRNKEDPHISHILDEDGLPHIGIRINPDNPILSFYNKKKGDYIIERYLERYSMYVHDVRIMGDVPSSSKNIPKSSKKISITFCIKKTPVVGDKFNTRHCAKGICSDLMRSEDMPFNDDGMIPDVLFNPHGLPSRMSIGMMFEMAASKAFICKGSKYTVEPFESKECETFEEIGEALTEAGFSYYGTETFYSGISGEELHADIFCGVLQYLRLHHVVEEKYQVRSIGPVDEKTNQPTNPGKSGAVRFGEMERDAILSHGAMVLTLDRLLLNSDKCTAFVCRRCHLLIPPTLPWQELQLENNLEQKKCSLCKRESNFKIQVPYVLCYLISELAMFGIRLKLSDE